MIPWNISFVLYSNTWTVCGGFIRAACTTAPLLFLICSDGTDGSIATLLHCCIWYHVVSRMGSHGYRHVTSCLEANNITPQTRRPKSQVSLFDICTKHVHLFSITVITARWPRSLFVPFLVPFGAGFVGLCYTSRPVTHKDVEPHCLRCCWWHWFCNTNSDNIAWNDNTARKMPQRSVACTHAPLLPASLVPSPVSSFPAL